MKAKQIKIVGLMMTAVFFVFDRFLKVAAINYISQPFKLIGEFFKFDFARNYNIAFSLPVSGFWLSAFILVIILGLIIFLLILFKQNKIIPTWLVLNIILGSSSNLFDRFKYGYVVDYLDLKYFTVFNLADVMIVGGVIGLLIVFLILDNKNKTC